AVGGEERLEQLPLARPRHARAVVDDAQFYAVGEPAHDQAHAARLLARVAHGVAYQVPHDLVQMPRIEGDGRVVRRLKYEALRRHRFVGDELLDERDQPGLQADALDG